ncbi:MAG: hypothetical protein AB7I27_08000 [Bacteriovoracaceae bacterium]
MKTTLIFLFVLASFNLFAQEIPKIVLLTSLQENASYSRTKNAKLEAWLEKKFFLSFEGQPYDLIVKHQTDPSFLWNTLNDQSVVVIFWVSHAKRSNQIASNLSDPGKIIDAYGNEVKNFFKNPGKNLHFLAVIGCEAEALLSAFEQQGEFRDLPHLKWISYSKKIEAKKGLKQAIPKAIEALSHLSFSTIQEEEQKTLHFVINSLREDDFKIELGGEVIGIFPSNTSEKDIFISESRWSQLKNKNIKITLIKSSQHLTSPTPPRFSIYLENNPRWKIFEMNQRPLGGEENLYLFH